MHAPKSTLKIGLSFVLGFFILQFATGFWVSREVPGRLGLKVTGNFWPGAVSPTFFSSDARLEWKNKVTLLSGNLKIDYNLLPLLWKHTIRLRVSGKNISARLQGDWAKMQGVENIRIDQLDADVEVAAQGLGEIYFVRAESPTFQFRIQKTGT